MHKNGMPTTNRRHLESNASEVSPLPGGGGGGGALPHRKGGGGPAGRRNDTPGGGGRGGQQNHGRGGGRGDSSPRSDLLPGFLPGAASLVEQLDRRALFVLRDGRHLVGVLRSFDQFSNCVLEDCSERRFLVRKGGGGDGPSGVYTDMPLGLYLVRGDSVVLLGEVDLDGSPAATPGASLVQVSLEDFERYEEEGQDDKERGSSGDLCFVKYAVNWDFE